MREILFRGKTEQGEWVEGYYLYASYSNKHYIQVWHHGFYSELQSFEVIPETVGQYTGLTDKNGRKIFEGDIVIAKQERQQDRAVITFENGAFIAQPVADKILEKTLWEYWWNDWDLEVIGNIYDNPELLEVTP